MKKKLRKALLAGLAASTMMFGLSTIAQATPLLITDSNDIALDNSTIIDFNSESTGAFNSRAFGSNVTFSAAGSDNLYIDQDYSGQYGATGRYLTNRNDNPGPFTIKFTEDVSAFGFSWGAADQPWTIELFNGSHISLGTLSINAQTPPFIGFIGGTDSMGSISYATLTTQSSYGYDYFILDNFEYVTTSTAPVPEPATMLLMGTGIAGLIAARRRKKA
jgi:hypothetical protein